MDKKISLIYGRLVLTQWLWAGVFVAGQIAVDEISPLVTALIRNIVASLVLLLILHCRQESERILWTKENIIMICLTGFFGSCLYSILVFTGLTYTTAISASLLIPTIQPITTVLLSAWVHKEKIQSSHYIGLFLSILGISAILTGSWALGTSNAELIGNALLMGAATSYSAYSVCSRTLVSKLPVLATVTYSTLAGTIFLIPITFSLEEPTVLTSASWSFWSSILYMAILSHVLPTIWWNEGIKILGTAKVGLLTLLMPLFALIIAFFLLQQQPTLLQLIGSLVGISGVILATGLIQPKHSLKSRS